MLLKRKQHQPQREDHDNRQGVFRNREALNQSASLSWNNIRGRHDECIDGVGRRNCRVGVGWLTIEEKFPRKEEFKHTKLGGFFAIKWSLNPSPRTFRNFASHIVVGCPTGYTACFLPKFGTTSRSIDTFYFRLQGILSQTPRPSQSRLSDHHGSQEGRRRS
jgi:hypothetical protein